MSFEMVAPQIFFLVLKINEVKEITRGGWLGFGMVTVGIDPTSITILNGHPTKIPPDQILGGVVKNCRQLGPWTVGPRTIGPRVNISI